MGKCVQMQNEKIPVEGGGETEFDTKWVIQCKCRNHETAWVACHGDGTDDSRACYSTGCENGIVNKEKIHPYDANATMMNVVNMRCSTVDNTVQTLNNKLSLGSIEVEGSYKNEARPFSLNEVPMQCLKNLNGYSTWYQDDKVWLEYAKREVDFSKELDDQIDMVFVNQKHGNKEAFTMEKKGLINVLEARCACGEKSWRVYRKDKLLGYNV